MSATPSVQWITALPSLPERRSDSHKGDFGRVLVVGGSRGMSGAACLAGKAALRAGAGLVTVAVPAGIAPIVAGFEPSYMTHSLAEDDRGQIDGLATPKIFEASVGQTVVALGPGLGQSDMLCEVVRDLYANLPIPVVVDADALNLMSRCTSSVTRAEKTAPRILTPHPGEFARLTGLNSADIQRDRQHLAVDFARKHRIILVLKGNETIITDGMRLAVNTTGNCGMATGGCGDVLTGVIAGLLAQGMAPLDAAQLGAYLHGSAGDLAAESLSKPGLIASDLLNFLCRAWCELGE